MYTRHTELRRLHEKDEYSLALKLNEYNCLRLIEIIPHRLNAQQSSLHGTLDWQQAIQKEGRKYRYEHFELMQNAFRASGGTRQISQILLDEWKTSGRKEERPTLGVLLQLLVAAECWMAADFVAAELLHEPKPKRPDGPAKIFDIPISELCPDVKDYVNDSSNYPDTEALNFNVNGFSTAALENNRDYRTKFMFDKKFAIPQQSDNTNSMTSTSNIRINNTTTAELMNAVEEQPRQNTQNSKTDTSTSVIPLLSTLMTKSNSTDVSQSQKQETYSSFNEAPIPNLSILALSSNAIEMVNDNAIDAPSPTENSSKTAVASEITHEILPELNELYLNGETGSLRQNFDDLRTQNAAGSISSSSSSNNDYDEEYIDEDFALGRENTSVPNLSFFEQHSSNNDSSLTSVTGTSGDNSFDLGVSQNEQLTTTSTIPTPNTSPTITTIKTEENVARGNAMDIETVNNGSEILSYDNIPCLSALKQ